MSSIVIGIGNPYRSDDAVGWLVIDALQNKAHGAIILSKQSGDIVDLIDAFTQYEQVYIVDACNSDSPVGSWQRIDVRGQPVLVASTQTSTHGLSVSQAIALARNLQLLPRKLIIYAISCNNFRMSDKLSVDLAATVNNVTEAILKEKDIYHARTKFN